VDPTNLQTPVNVRRSIRSKQASTRFINKEELEENQALSFAFTGQQLYNMPQ